jgi:hypothetical protein
MAGSINGIRAADVDLEVMRAFHVDKNTFGVSIELSDQYNERGRSYLLIVEFDGERIRYEIVLQIENLMLDHVSMSPAEHVLLEVGGVTHFLNGRAHRTARTPEPFFHKLFRPSGGPLFTYGEDGWVCQLYDMAWRPIEPGSKAFLRCMHGPSTEMLHVGGNFGTLLHLKGDVWVQIPLNFNKSIEALHVAEDGTISIGCEDGFCREVRDGSIRVIEAPDSDFLSIRDFKGRRFWGENDFGLFVQEGDRLIEFRALEFAFAMESSPELLVVTGWREVFLFDGSSWLGFEFAYDGDLLARTIDMGTRYR